MKELLPTLRRFGPLVLPVAVVAAVWAAFIRPARAAQAHDAARLIQLRERLANMPEAAAAGSGDAREEADPAAVFQARVSASDATTRLLRAVTTAASSVGARNLFVDSTGALLNVAGPGGPRVEAAAEPDPRLALFGTPLAYATVPVSFDARFAALGDFLWQFRDLPVVVEIRELTVTSSAEPRGTASPVAGVARAASDAGRTADGMVSASMTLFVYLRQAPVAQRTGAGEQRR
jgi:hypothetical protein